jgi:hypothetical protein
MTTLDISTPGELRLVLRGAAENAILNTLRHWPYWLSVEIEHDPVDKARHLSVTLITGQNHEVVLREILRRSFGMIFPPEGGERPLIVEAKPEPVRRGFGVRRS